MGWYNLNIPLAERIRPTTLDEVVGQSHLIGEDKILTNILKSDKIPNMIFYGPSGTGKTTVANICAKEAKRGFYKLNATTSGLKDVRDVVEKLELPENENGILLYLDEIQNFNKKQQQSLLEYIENGKITLIASTTENPHFYIYNAILSRSTVLEFKKIDPLDIKKAIERAVKIIDDDYTDRKITFDDDAIEHIANASGGDVRKAVNAVEVCVLSQSYTLSEVINITLDVAVECTQTSSLVHDKNGDSHYDVISAFQKSIRGSDADAAIHYLARLLAGGDLITVCRRLLVIASEDIGLAYPNAVVITKACVDSALQLGLPEARIPLSEATILLASAPKSNSAICAIDEAMSDVENIDTGDIPLHLKDSHYQGAKSLGRGVEYKYPHAYKNNYVKQQYLPDKIKDKKYYNRGDNKTENSFYAYWKDIKKDWYKLKIYTKTGDEGFSDVLKKRVKKSDNVFNVIGTIDKLSSSLNFARNEIEDENLKEEILNLQKNLVSLNGFVSGYSSFSCDVVFFEKRIDYFLSKTGPFCEFTFARTKAGAYLDFARCICRDAERYATMEEGISQDVLKYLNRMSDYLYSFSRYVDIME